MLKIRPAGFTTVMTPSAPCTEDDCNAIGLIKETFHLVAGSALFVPGGVVHRVETTGKVCGLRFNVEARR
jgi:hypothetical protein